MSYNLLVSQKKPTATEFTDPQKEEESGLAADENLAKSYTDLSSQNSILQRLILALAAAGAGRAQEIISAYNLINKPLDPKKLIADPAYRDNVISSLQIVEKREQGAIRTGKSKCAEAINTTKEALIQVNETHEKTRREYIGLTKQYGIDIRRIYGLSDKEMEEVFKKTSQILKDNPHSSPKDALRKTAENLVRQRVTAEVTDDKRVTKSGREGEIEKRIKNFNLEEKKRIYESNFNVQTIHDYEKQRREAIYSDGGQRVARILGVEYKVEDSSEKARAEVIKRAPKESDQAFVPIKVKRIDSQVKPPLFSTVIKIPGIRTRIAGFAEKKILNKGLSFLTNKGLALIPGIGTGLAAVNSVLSQFGLGLDQLIGDPMQVVRKFLTTATIIALIILVPVIMLFLSSTGDTANMFPLSPQQATSGQSTKNNEERKYTFKEFEKEYLNAKSSIIKWQTFENKFLTGKYGGKYWVEPGLSMNGQINSEL